MVSGSVPAKPISQLFEKTAITASADNPTWYNGLASVTLSHGHHILDHEQIGYAYFVYDSRFYKVELSYINNTWNNSEIYLGYDGPYVYSHLVIMNRARQIFDMFSDGGLKRKMSLDQLGEIPTGGCLDLSNTVPDGYAFNKYTASAGTLDSNTLTMPDEDVTISAELSEFGDHFTKNGDTFTIHDYEGWKIFCKLVNNSYLDGFTGKTILLDGDITVSCKVGKVANDVQKTAGGGHAVLPFYLHSFCICGIIELN